jgi:hypothetical protein
MISNMKFSNVNFRVFYKSLASQSRGRPLKSSGDPGKDEVGLADWPDAQQKITLSLAIAHQSSNLPAFR